MSRDLTITRNRSKLVIVAAAGTLTLATAVSAAAAVWSSGSPAAAAPPRAAFSVIVDRPGHAAADQHTGHDYLAAHHVRFAAEHRGLMILAARQAAAHAAHQAAVAQAARRKAQAEPAAQQAAQARQAAQQAQQAAQQAAQRAAQSRPQAVSSSAPVAPTPPPPSGTQQTAASGSPQSIARSMLGSFGWSGSQFDCLKQLWAGESGWSVSATNPSTGAYGIPQAMPGSKMASAGADWQTDAATQIRWGLGYIQATYTTPCSAWNHEQADGWY